VVSDLSFHGDVTIGGDAPVIWCETIARPWSLSCRGVMIASYRSGNRPQVKRGDSGQPTSPVASVTIEAICPVSPNEKLVAVPEERKLEPQ
jgi:hypothetical protein